MAARRRQAAWLKSAGCCCNVTHSSQSPQLRRKHLEETPRPNPDASEAMATEGSYTLVRPRRGLCWTAKRKRWSWPARRIHAQLNPTGGCHPRGWRAPRRDSGREEDAHHKETDSHWEPCCPCHCSPPVAGEKREGGRTTEGLGSGRSVGEAEERRQKDNEALDPPMLVRGGPIWRSQAESSWSNADITTCSEQQGPEGGATYRHALLFIRRVILSRWSTGRSNGRKKTGDVARSFLKNWSSFHCI
jgi:hypothetical protein